MPSSSITRFNQLSPQLWDLGDGGYLFINDSVLEVIDRFRQHANSAPEAGGFLAGFYKGLDLHLINLTLPQSRDRRGRFRFDRLDPQHVHQVTQWYEQSAGEINCLGEWHTHPESSPKPSLTDIDGWHLFNKDRNGQRAIFLIAGTANIWTGELQMSL